MVDVNTPHNQASTAEEEGLQGTNSTGVRQSDAVQASRQMLVQPTANTEDPEPLPPPQPPVMAAANRFTAAAFATPRNSLRPAEAPQDMSTLPVLSSIVAGRNLNRRDLPLVCHVIDCGVSLANHADYYQRYRICKDHLRCPAMIVEGFPQRFCQQCGRFHDLNAFDLDRRNCRARLAQHNSRRRKYGITNGVEMEKAAPAPGQVQSARRRAAVVEYAKYDDAEYDLDYDEMRRRQQRARTGDAVDVSGATHHGGGGGGDLGDGGGLLDQLVAAATGIEAATLEHEEKHTIPVRLHARPQDSVYHHQQQHQQQQRQQHQQQQQQQQQQQLHHQQQQQQRHQNGNNSNRNRNHLLPQDDSTISGYFGTSTIPPQALESGRGGSAAAPPSFSMFGGSPAAWNGGGYPPNAATNTTTGGGGGGAPMHPSSSMPAAAETAAAVSVPAVASILSELEHLLGRRMLMQMMQHAGGGGGGGGFAGVMQQQQQQMQQQQQQMQHPPSFLLPPSSSSADMGGNLQVLELLRMLSSNGGGGSGALPSPSMQQYNSATSTQSGLQLNSMASQFSVPHPALHQQRQQEQYQEQQLQSFHQNAVPPRPFQPIGGAPTNTTNTSIHMLDALCQLAAMRGGAQPEPSPFVTQFLRDNSSNNVNSNTTAALLPHPSAHRPTPIPLANNLPNALPFDIMQQLVAAVKPPPSTSQPLPIPGPWQSALHAAVQQQQQQQQHVGSNGGGIHTSNSNGGPAAGSSISSSAAMQRLLEMLQSSPQVTQNHPQLKFEQTSMGGAISHDGGSNAAVIAAAAQPTMTPTMTNTFTQQLMAMLQQTGGAGLVQPPLPAPLPAAAAPTTTASPHDEIKTKADADTPQDA